MERLAVPSMTETAVSTVRPAPMAPRVAPNTNRTSRHADATPDADGNRFGALDRRPRLGPIAQVNKASVSKLAVAASDQSGVVQKNKAVNTTQAVMSRFSAGGLS